MKTVTLAYGRTRLPVEVPDDAAVITPVQHPAAPDVPAELRRALREPVSGPPLRERVRRGQTVAISACDGTRAAAAAADDPGGARGARRHRRPRRRRRPGRHRHPPGQHRGRAAGDVRRRGRRLGADRQPRLPGAATRTAGVGTFGDGVPVWLNEQWVDADVRLTTGFVEPHFFAGFSGGPKMVAPGLAALDTVLVLHDAKRIGDPRATWGVTQRQPGARRRPRHRRGHRASPTPSTSCSTPGRRSSRRSAATCCEMHAAAIERAREVAMAPVDAPFDVVRHHRLGLPAGPEPLPVGEGHVGGRAGGPAGRARSSARPSARDGFPDHGSYREVLTSAASPEALLDLIAAREQTVPDQWQVQIQARIQSAHRVVMHTDHLTDDRARRGPPRRRPPTSRRPSPRPCGTAGPGARVCVLPEGPQTIPYVRGSLG